MKQEVNSEQEQSKADEKENQEV